MIVISSCGASTNLNIATVRYSAAFTNLLSDRRPGIISHLRLPWTRPTRGRATAEG
jgi:hypothetical protein